MALGLAACKTTPEEETPAASTTSSDVKDSEFGQGQMPDPAPDTSAVDLELATVYFDFDRSDVRADARPILRANAEAIGGADVMVTIEGHTDERGSEEYNQALGERRASAAKRYLQNLGVPRSKVRTVSYGETRPSVMGHDESAWRYNRRADFVAGR